MEISQPASGTKASGLQSSMTRDEVIAWFARRQKAYENLDAAALAADYAPDAVIESPTAGVHDGRAAAMAIRAWFNAFPDLRLTTEEIIVEGDRVAQLASISATHVGEFLGLPPTGKPFHVNAAFVFELKNGRIVRERRIYDFTGMLMQIGVLKAKPV